MEIGIKEVVAGLDFFAIAMFLGISLFAIIKPEKVYLLLRSKKKKGLVPDTDTLKKVRIYAVIIFLLVGFGFVEKFI